MVKISRKSLLRFTALWGVIGLAGLGVLTLAPALGQQDGASTSSSGSIQIDLVVGQQKILTIPYAFGDIAIGNSRVVGTTPFRERREILLNGLRAGSSTLLIFDTRGNRRGEYEIQVLSENLQKLLLNVKSLLGDIEGLRYRITGDRIFIEGEVFLEEEQRRVQAVAEKNPNIMQFVTLSPVTQRIVANTIEKEIGRPDITVKPLRNQILLEGTVYSETAKIRAEAIARAYYSNVVNVLDVRQADRPPSKDKTIVLIAHYVSLSKSLLNSWGFEWTPLASSTPTGSLVDATLGATYDFSTKMLSLAPASMTGAASVLLPRIERAKSSGYARVLENPTVSVKSGELVSMFSGMQYPYAIVTNLGVSIEWKDIGIRMESTPYAQGDSVDMKLKIEVTDLGQVSNAQGDPAIDTARVETRQFAKAGESIVIAGLARMSDSVIYNKKPDSVVGALFQLYKSKEYNKAKSQFLVFLTPQIHETSSTANKEIQEKFNLKEVKQ